LRFSGRRFLAGESHKTLIDIKKERFARVRSAGRNSHDLASGNSGNIMDHNVHCCDHEMHAGHEGHAGHDINVLRRKFWAVLVLTIPVVIYSKGVQMLLGFTPPEFPGSLYIPAILGTVIFFYGGLFFLQGAVDELRNRLPGMMTLIGMAITVAFVYSLGVTAGLLAGEALYWELSTLIAIMLLGHWIEMGAISRASGALQELAKLMPDVAERIADGRTEIVPIDALRAGDLVLVRPGAKIPADGEVVDGVSSVNEAMITGESRPVRKSSEEKVIAGTVNGAGSMRVRVTKIGEDTALAGIMRLVAEAQTSRSMTQNLADRAAYWLTLVAISAGVITFVVWTIAPVSEAFVLERTVTVLVITCPHALGLAIPLVIAISTTMAAKNGLLVRDRFALEQARNLDVVVFDKTGTLTRGEHGVVGVYAVPEVDENEALALAAAVEQDSEHMLAKAIVRSAQEKELALPQARDFTALPGLGVKAKVDARAIMVGGPNLLESELLDVPDVLKDAVDKARAAGHTLVYLIDEGHVRAVIALADVVRPESKEAVRDLKNMGVSVAMMTGDSRDVAGWVAGELGIDEYYANVLPEEKDKRIREIRRRGRRVAMVGDGVNDAPALVSADVGIAIGAGTDVAIEAGGIILVKNDPRDVARIIRLSRASYRKMVENLLWATGYNVASIPLAAGALAGYGIVLPPAVGALLMSASTVIVAANAQLLRKLRL
jgi:P-type Cu2+ transporter